MGTLDGNLAVGEQGDLVVAATLIRKGKEVKFDSEQLLSFSLRKPLKIVG